jgi:hypothetical protein
MAKMGGMRYPPDRRSFLIADGRMNDLLIHMRRQCTQTGRPLGGLG